MTEPLTWVNPPIDAVTLVSPHPFQIHFVGAALRAGVAPFENWFHETTIRYGKKWADSLEYGEKWADSLVYADCGQSTIRYTRSDESGRPVTPSPVKMGAQERDFYCEHDWAREKEALRRWSRQ